MVTPRLTEGLSQPAMPEYPKPFLDPQKFDGKAGESPSRQ
jgi:hypothetical protein